MLKALTSFITHCKSYWGITTDPRSGFGYVDNGADAYWALRQPYKFNPHVRTAVGMLARAVSGVPFIVSNKDGDVIDTGPLVDALNSYPGGIRKFLYEYIGQFELTGEAHIVFDLAEIGAGTVNIFGAYSMEAITSEDGLELRGWEVTVPYSGRSVRTTNDAHGRISTDQGSGRRVWKYPVGVDDVHSWIDPNLYPGCMHRGLSKLESLQLTLSEDHSAASHNAMLLARGGGPRGLLKTEQSLQPEQADALEERFEAKYGRVSNSFKVAVLSKGTEWQSIVQSNKELMILDSRKMSQAFIYQVFGVPSVVAGGENKGGVKSHEANALNTFWVNRIWPLVSTVGENLTDAFVPRLASHGTASGRKSRSMYCKAVRSRTPDVDVIVWGDLTQVPALRDWHWSQIKTMSVAVQNGIPLNEVIETMDLPFTPDKEWGDTWWVPSGLRPADQAMKEPEPPPVAPPVAPENEPDSEVQDDKVFRATAAEVNAKWVASWGKLASAFEKSLKRFFFQQRAEQLQRLDEAAPEGEKSQECTGFARGDEFLIVRDWLDDALPDLVKENDVLIEVADKPIRNGLNLGGAQIAAEVEGVNPFAMSDDFYQQFLPDRMARIVRVNAVTKDMLRIQFAQATEAGETLREIKERVKHVFREATDSRALTIARTETAMSVNQGRKVGMKENGVQAKGWLDSKDEHTRETHLQAGVDYADGIPLGQPFIVGGAALDHPSDPAGPASEVINCRCALLPMLPGKVWADVVGFYKGVGFVPWSEG